MGELELFYVRFCR